MWTEWRGGKKVRTSGTSDRSTFLMTGIELQTFFMAHREKARTFLCSGARQTCLIILFIGGNFDQLWKLIKLSVYEKFIEGNIRVNRFELAAKLPLKHLPLTDALYGSLHCLVLTIPHAPVIRFIKSMLARSSM